MTPRTAFENNFRTAETILKVYQLLVSNGNPTIAAELISQVRTLFQTGQEEELVFLLNDLFLGVVREHANMRSTFFRPAQLCLFLRQAVVAACAAMDVYSNDLLQRNLLTVFLAKQRNFSRRHLREIQLSLDDYLSIVQDPDPNSRLEQLLLKHFERKTLSNVEGLTEVLEILGIERPWWRIAQAVGLPENSLRQQIQNVVARRNDIIHRGDRPAGFPDSDPQSIDYPWTHSHIQAIHNVVLASDDLVEQQMAALVPADTLVEEN